MPQFSTLLRRGKPMPDPKPIFPYGHFYSPIVDPANLSGNDALFAPRQTLAGIDFRPELHTQILREWFPKFLPDYDYPDEGDIHEPTSYFHNNDQFSWLDARALYVMLRQLQPRSIIEVGSGFSSLLIADVVRRYLSDSRFTCIEPYPRAFLRRGIPGVTELKIAKAEHVPATTFEQLVAGDVLFIDSSHVCKTGSDVNFLFFDVLPRLASGVVIHVHDIFLPLEYPRAWVIDENRSWNEQYLLQALLMFSTRFEVLFGCAYAATFLGHDVVAALNRPDGHGMGGGSFWLRVR